MPHLVRGLAAADQVARPRIVYLTGKAAFAIIRKEQRMQTDSARDRLRLASGA
jgi:hypothetical protein